jgi:O-antigen/teichoic acid export membrane protein
MNSIKHQFAVSSIWIVLGRGSTNIGGFLIFVLLARLLGPADFGLVGFAALFVEITRPMALAGFPQALIQRSGWDPEVSSNAFWANIVFAIVLAAVITFVVTPIMMASFDPRIEWVLPVLSANLIIDAMRAPHEALLQRRFAYKIMARQNVITMLVSGAVGIAFAYAGYGVWALVINRAVGSVLLTSMTWRSARWMPQFTFSVEKVKPLFGFGMHLTGALMMGQMNRRVADFMIGWLMGAAPVGIYRLGSRAVNIMNDAIIQPMNATALSAFSRVNERGSVASAYLRLTKACGLVSYPAFFGASVLATEIVAICFGPKWHESGNVFAFLALTSGAGTLNFFTNPALNSVGKTRLVFWMSMISLFTTAAITLITVRFGVAAVALGLAIRAYLQVPLAMLMLNRGLDLPVRRAIGGVMPPFLAATVMALALFAIKIELLSEFSHVTRIAILVPTGAVLYIGLLMVFARGYLKEMNAELLPLIKKMLDRFVARRPSKRSEDKDDRGIAPAAIVANEHRELEDEFAQDI